MTTLDPVEFAHLDRHRLRGVVGDGVMRLVCTGANCPWEPPPARAVWDRETLLAVAAEHAAAHETAGQ